MKTLRIMLFLGIAALTFILVRRAVGADFQDTWSKDQREDMWGRCMSTMLSPPAIDYELADKMCKCMIVEMEAICPSYHLPSELQACLDKNAAAAIVLAKCVPQPKQ